MFSLLCNYWLLVNFDILYFSTDSCINKSLTYLLTYLLTYIFICSSWPKSNWLFLYHGYCFLEFVNVIGIGVIRYWPCITPISINIYWHYAGDRQKTQKSLHKQLDSGCDWGGCCVIEIFAALSVPLIFYLRTCLWIIIYLLTYLLTNLLIRLPLYSAVLITVVEVRLWI